MDNLLPPFYSGCFTTAINIAFFLGYKSVVFINSYIYDCFYLAGGYIGRLAAKLLNIRKRAKVNFGRKLRNPYFCHTQRHGYHNLQIEPT